MAEQESSSRPVRRPQYLWPGIALAGIVVIAAAFVMLSRAEVRSKIDKVRSDFEALDKGLAWYGVDMSGWVPPDTRLRRREDPSIRLTFDSYPGLWYDQPTKSASLAPKTSRSLQWTPLTTPIRYLQPEAITDPFRDGQVYAYTSWCSYVDKQRNLVVVQSPGPDGTDDLPIEQLRDSLGALWEESKQPDQRWPEPNALHAFVAPHLYDPTNGLSSRGDMVLLWNEQGSAATIRHEGSWFWRDGRRPGIDPPRKE